MDPGRVILIAGRIGLLALVMMLLAVLSRRILGVRVGPARTILALVVAVVAEFLFESQVLWQIPVRGLAFISLQFGIALFAAFLFLVVAELVLPRGVLPPPHTWLPALRAGSQRGIRSPRSCASVPDTGSSRSGPQVGAAGQLGGSARGH